MLHCIGISLFTERDVFEIACSIKLTFTTIMHLVKLYKIICMYMQV